MASANAMGKLVSENFTLIITSNINKRHVNVQLACVFTNLIWNA